MIQFLTVFIIAVLVVIDQLIKLAVLKYLEPIGSLTVIPKVIQLSYHENTGAAFGCFISIYSCYFGGTYNFLALQKA